MSWSDVQPYPPLSMMSWCARRTVYRARLRRSAPVRMAVSPSVSPVMTVRKRAIESRMMSSWSGCPPFPPRVLPCLCPYSTCADAGFRLPGALTSGQVAQVAQYSSAPLLSGAFGEVVGIGALDLGKVLATDEDDL